MCSGKHLPRETLITNTVTPPLVANSDYVVLGCGNRSTPLNGEGKSPLRLENIAPVCCKFTTCIYCIGEIMSGNMPNLGHKWRKEISSCVISACLSFHFLHVGLQLALHPTLKCLDSILLANFELTLTLETTSIATLIPNLLSAMTLEETTI